MRVDRRQKHKLRCDVLVVGGGAAGVATAATAARQGLQVVLVERYGFCGGGAVAGLSGTICGLYLATDRPSARPEQVVFGFASEFCHALESRGGLGEAVRYGKTWTHVHDPAVWRDVADAVLRSAGVRIIYHAVAFAVLVEGDQINGVEVWTKQGPVEIRARMTIDASGDADLVAMAGWRDVIGDNGRVQNPTMIFRLGGVDMNSFQAAHGSDTIMSDEVSRLIAEAQVSGRYALPRTKIWLFPTTRPGELLCNCTRISGHDGRDLNTLLFRDFTEAEIEGRRQVREYERFFRDTLPGCQRAYLVDTGVQVGIRQTRQVAGVGRLTNDDVVAARKFSDGIARSPWPIELHEGERPKVKWILDDYYEVPLSCFVPEAGEHLMVAGRCLSAEHEAVASARVTAQCFAYGHAVGLAASLAVRNDLAPRELSGADVRLLLNGSGASL